MIHHYVTPERVIELTKLHDIVLCKDCNKISRGDLYCSVERKHMYLLRQACDMFVPTVLKGQKDIRD